ncbi:MAG: AI-2E family transporter [Opitutales bacterium]
MSSEPLPILGPNQRRLVGYTISFACFILIIALVVFSIGVLGRLVSIFSSLLWPLAVAGILAIMLRPVVFQLQTRLHTSPLLAVILLYGVFSLAGVAILALILPVIVAQARDFVVMLPQLVNQAVEYLQENLPRWADLFDDQKERHAALQEHIEGILARLSEWLLTAAPGILAAGGMILGVFGLAAGLAIVPVYLFFFLQSQKEPTESLHEALPFLKPETRGDVVFLAREFVSIIVAFFRGQLLIALIVGVLLATGFTVAGLRFSIILGLGLGLLNIVPYLGVILGLLIAVPIAFLQPGGSLAIAGIVAGIFLVVQTVESTFLTPKIMGDRTGLHPVVIIIAIFFWGIALGGLLGMILAIPLTAFFVTAWRLARRKYIGEIA